MNNIGVITGATGYIGSNLLRYLLSKSWDIYIIVRPGSNLSNIEDVRNKIHFIEYDNDINVLMNFFKEVNPDAVFHLAATVITDPKPEQITTLIQSNIQFGTVVLEAMKYSSTRIFISTGSYWQNYNSDSYNPVDLYAATKEAFEKIIKYYVEAFNFQSVSLRLFDVYGENDKRPKLLNLLYSNEEGTSIDVSLGEQLLDMVHISDVCSAYLAAYELLKENKDIKNEIFGVYTGNRASLKDTIGLFENILDTKFNINFGKRPYKFREVMIPCSTHIKLPNWEAKISLEEGLKRFRKNV